LQCVIQLNAWQDPSHHTIKFVTADINVQLEVLDWGGHGKSIILLAGGGNTAHVFDDFAPKLAANFHVYGITRRGFGASGYSAIENVDRLGKDILAVIDSLKIIKTVLAGHSIAGAELSSVACIAPDRIRALIYLKAAYPYAFSNEETPKMNEFMEIAGPQSPSPGEKNLTSFNELQMWDAKTYGFQMPESEPRDGTVSLIKFFECIVVVLNFANFNP
jgi:pimeloyl-ACP methyl ester carboxylesterase